MDDKTHRDRIIADPLCAAPPELERDIFRLWCCVQHLFPSVLPLAGLVRVWVDSHGLSIADAKAVLNSMLSPECVGSFKFAADLTTALASRVDLRLKQVAKETEQARRREAQLDLDADAPKAERGELARMFAERLRMPE